MKQTAAERLTAAKVAKDFAIRKIAEGEAHRRQALLDGDDAMAQAADLVIAALKLQLARRTDEIELLRNGPLQREDQDSRFPPDPAAARQLLADKERRHRALLAKHPHDLSAADQMEIDGFPIAQGQLQQHIQRLERMAS
jgi:hypothetical protein